MHDTLDTAFWIAAIGGTAMFVLKLAVLMFGGGHDHDAGGGEAGHDGAGGEHGSSWAFQFLTVQSLATFAMGAGWAGLVARPQLDGNGAQAVAAGVLFGAALVFVSLKLMSKLRKLESSGTLDIRNALGQSGTVYLTVPQGGAGQVEVVMQGRIATFDAVSSEAPIATGARVRVQAVDRAGRLVVAPA